MTVDDCLTKWIALTQRVNQMELRLEKVLTEEKLTLKEFYVLYFLNQAEGKTMRLQKLEQLIGLSQSAMSRMIVRMENSVCCAFIERYHCCQDKRGVCIALTDKGSAKLKRVLPLVDAVLQKYL